MYLLPDLEKKLELLIYPQKFWPATKFLQITNFFSKSNLIEIKKYKFS